MLTLLIIIATVMIAINLVSVGLATWVEIRDEFQDTSAIRKVVIFIVLFVYLFFALNVLSILKCYASMKEAKEQEQSQEDMENLENQIKQFFEEKRKNS